MLDIDNHSRSNESDCEHGGGGGGDGDGGIDLHLQRSTKLLDDNFVFIRRDENHTQLIDDFDKLAERYSNCFYRNENSAIDLCDGNVVSGLFCFFYLYCIFFLFYDLNEKPQL